MAKAKTAAPTGKIGKAPPKQSNPLTILIMFICIILAVFLPTACLVVPGMLPAMVAFICDRDREKAAAITVFAMNASGVVPLVVELWKQGHSFDASFALLAQPINWTLMYGAAAVGWLLVFIIPPFVASVMASSAEARIKQLQGNQDELKKIWGTDVAG